jgi:hypothetical protein
MDFSPFFATQNHQENLKTFAIPMNRLEPTHFKTVIVYDSTDWENYSF